MLPEFNPPKPGSNTALNNSVLNTVRSRRNPFWKRGTWERTNDYYLRIGFWKTFPSSEQDSKYTCTHTISFPWVKQHLCRMRCYCTRTHRSWSNGSWWNCPTTLWNRDGTIRTFPMLCPQITPGGRSRHPDAQHLFHWWEHSSIAGDNLPAIQMDEDLFGGVPPRKDFQKGKPFLKPSFPVLEQSCGGLRLLSRCACQERPCLILQALLTTTIVKILDEIWQASPRPQRTK